MCGGSGTRLWPLSRAARPKQFHPLVTENSLLAETITRALRLPGVTAKDILLLSGESLAAIAREEMEKAGAADATLIVEPAAKNTAPAAALAALFAQEKGEDAIVLLLASDHHIGDDVAFGATVAAGAALAARDFIVTFGITPDSPHIGYGYIKRGAVEAPGFRVAKFQEKPDLETARRLLDEGDNDWNSGIYMYKPDVFLDELMRHEPAVRDAVGRAYSAGWTDSAGFHPEAGFWDQSPSISIDNAVAERTDRAATVPADMKWSDVGGWTALWDISEKDENQNVMQGDVLAVGVTNSYVRADGRLVALVGVSDLVVIETADAICIAPRERAEEVKQLVNSLSKSGRKDKL
jgi:mannose-1-phosphate guanylyltransferase/mannose-6-phosphate isomerase